MPDTDNDACDQFLLHQFLTRLSHLQWVSSSGLWMM